MKVILLKHVPKTGINATKPGNCDVLDRKKLQQKIPIRPAYLNTLIFLAEAVGILEYLSNASRHPLANSQMREIVEK